MASPIILVCKYQVQVFAFKLCDDTTLSDVLSSICKRWKNLCVGRFSLSYSLGDGYCCLDNKEDFDNMMILYRSSDRIDAKVDEEIVNEEIPSGTAGSLCLVQTGGNFLDKSRCFIVGSSSAEVSSVDMLDDGDDEFCAKEKDPMEKFCRHPEKTYLTYSWGGLIHSVGQEFRDVIEFRQALQKFSVENGFNYRFVKNDLFRVTARCVVEGCGWYVHAIVNRSNKVFHIKELENEHSCGSTYRDSKHKRMTSSIIASEIVDLIHKKPKTTPKDMVDHFTENYGLDVQYHSAWLAVEKTKGGLWGAYETSFDKLRWYVEAARVTNPGSILKLEFDPVSNEFSRIFVAFDACIKGFNHCRPLLCLDAAHLKGRFKGSLLAATGKDANQGLFPLAFAIVDAENDANWSWFLGLLKNILSSRPVTFISDRNSGLVKFIPVVFPHCYHAYCLYHLHLNLNTHFSGRCGKGFRARLAELFDNCAYAPSVHAYMECESLFIKHGGVKGRTFLESCPKEHWANAYFQGNRYGEMSSSAVESFNNWVLEARGFHVAKLVDELRGKIMNQRSCRKEKSLKLNSVLCQKMDKLLAARIKKGRSWKVMKSRSGLYEVKCNPRVVVNVDEGTCSCGGWQYEGFLCRHAVAVIIKACGGEGSLRDHIDPFFLVEAYSASYEENIHPIVSMDIPDFTEGGELVIKAPRNKRPPGRPKKKRIPSNGEYSTTRSLKCSRCGRSTRHNRRTCKEPTDG